MNAEQELKALKKQVRDFFKAARDQDLWIGAGYDGNFPRTDKCQYGPMAKALLEAVKEEGERA